MTTAEYATLLGAIYLTPFLPRWFLLSFGCFFAIGGVIGACLNLANSDLPRILQQLM